MDLLAPDRLDVPLFIDDDGPRIRHLRIGWRIGQDRLSQVVIRRDGQLVDQLPDPVEAPEHPDPLLRIVPLGVRREQLYGFDHLIDVLFDGSHGRIGAADADRDGLEAGVDGLEMPVDRASLLG